MTVPFYCVLVALVLAYLPSFAVATSLVLQHRLDNHAPRRQAATLTGWHLRCKSAHYNGLEALTGFAAGVFVAHLAGADSTLSAQLAVAFVVARLAYIACYLADLSTLRSTVWTAGFTITLGFFLLPLVK